jgi:hypothetical protein
MTRSPNNVSKLSIFQLTAFYLVLVLSSGGCSGPLCLLSACLFSVQQPLNLLEDWPVALRQTALKILPVSESAGRTSHGPAAGSRDVTSSSGFARHNSSNWGPRRSCQVPLAAITGPKIAECTQRARNPGDVHLSGSRGMYILAR